MARKVAVTDGTLPNDPRHCVAGDQRTAVGGKRVGVVEIHHRGAVGHGGRQVDAHLLDDVARDFGDGHLQHHLVAAANRDRIDHLVRAADQAGGHVGGLLCLDRCCGGAAQHHAVADTVDLDVRVRQRLLQRGAYAVEVALDRDVIGRNLLACGIEENDVGLADRGADDIGALGGADDGVGDLRIGDQHVLDLARQVDHDGFADPERKKTRVHLPFGGGGRRGAIVARHHRRQRRVQRERSRGRKRQGADQECPHWLIFPVLHFVRPFGHFCIDCWRATP